MRTQEELNEAERLLTDGLECAMLNGVYDVAGPLSLCLDFLYWINEKPSAFAERLPHIVSALNKYRIAKSKEL